MMRRLSILLTTLVFTGFMLAACGDSGTGPGDEGETTTYTVDLSSTEGGAISPSGSNSYNEGEEIEIEANANDEYTFSGWSGDVESSENPLSLTVDQNYELTANFEIKKYDLAINTEGEGEVSEEVVGQNKEYDSGTVVELTANPAEGWQFVKWKGDNTTSDNPIEIAVDNPKEVTAVFEKKSYSLTINTDGEGSVAKDPDQSEYDYNSNVELTANPADGYGFVEWTNGEASSSDNPQNITMNRDTSLTAVFEKKSYSLTVNIDGEGSVAKDPDQSEYDHNSSVELTANAADGWQFVEWTGDLSSSENPQQITMDASKEVTAVFKEQSAFYLAENEVTIKCEDAEVGDTGTVNGVTYTKRKADQITTDNAPTTCTSGITDMSYLFDGVDSFNGDITHWDVSEVTRMNRMFTGVDLFNKDISHWDVSSVQNMDRMFWLASDFNQDLSGWCVNRIATKPDDFDVGTHDDFEGNINKLPDWGTCPGS